jgi:hypothetical protein
VPKEEKRIEFTSKSIFLYFLVKFLERKYLTNEDDLEKIALKIVVRDAIIIFCTTLTANFIYSNTHNPLIL